MDYGLLPAIMAMRTDQKRAAIETCAARVCVRITQIGLDGPRDNRARDSIAYCFEIAGDHRMPLFIIGSSLCRRNAKNARETYAPAYHSYPAASSQ